MKMQHEWMNNNYRDAGRYLICLIKGALNETDAGAKPENISWKDIYKIAQKNGVEGISYCGLKNLSEFPEDEIVSSWEQGFQMTCYRKLRFDVEREQILQEMSASGLSFLPLKGILVASYYPKIGMRSMADNDILYGIVEEVQQTVTGVREDASNCLNMPDLCGYRIAGANEAERENQVLSAQKRMVEIMKARGYEVKSLAGNHDSFLKEPMFNFEMHRKLVAESSPFYFYYRNPWARAVQDEKNPFLFSFPDEDEYIYLLAHSFKHFDNSGCGIRFLIDLFAFLERKGKDLDWSYVEGELYTLHLTEFEKQMRELAFAAFGREGDLSQDQEEMMFFLMGCGTYGTMQIRINKQLQNFLQETEGNTKRAKLKYVYERLFMPIEVWKDAFPFFYRHRIFRPLLPAYRIGMALIHRPKHLRSELRILWKTLRKKE